MSPGVLPGLRMTVLFWAVSTPSEFQPRITEQNRNGIDTGGTPDQNWVGWMCQISSAYWRMVRSEENFAPLAMFIRHLRPKVIRSA